MRLNACMLTRTQYRWESSIGSPRLELCALNPYNGESGAFRWQEINHMRPAIVLTREKGVNVQRLFPCGTVFLNWGQFDGIVTIYHDQGQIAMKLLSFDSSVTV
ncbi:hypothetical protein F5Y19DRAFT_421459 [Xylariaceae sp. FL1651]|nr:hypothetical protein F5Y19DRAFT_421459 [Xylariaceae sp. FL1651]